MTEKLLIRLLIGVFIAVLTGCSVEPSYSLNARSAADDSRLYFNGYPMQFFAAPLTHSSGALRSPEVTRLFAGKAEGAGGHYAIYAYFAGPSSEIEKETLIFDLESGVIDCQKISHIELPHNRVALAPPQKGGDYFAYRAALDEIKKIARSFTKNSDALEMAQPDVENLIGYLDYVANVLQKDPIEAVALDSPRAVKPAGRYHVSASYKAMAPRNIEVDFMVGSDVVARTSTVQIKGTGKVDLLLAIPAALPTGAKGVFAVKLLDPLAPVPRVVAQAQNSPIPVLVTNSIDQVIYSSSMIASKEMVNFAVQYSAREDGVLRVVLQDGNDPTRVYATSDFPAVSGDRQLQQVQLVAPAAIDTTVSGFIRIEINLLDKTGKVLAADFLQQNIAT